MSDANTEKVFPKSRRLPPIIYVIGTICIICFILCLYLFIHSYRASKIAVQDERANYVAEISNQIVGSLVFMRREFAGDADMYAQIIDGGDFSSLEQMRDALGTRAYGELILISSDGNLMDLQGQGLFITDHSLMLAMEKSGGNAQLFTSLNGEQDCWLFASSIEPVVLNGYPFDAIALAVPSDEFRDILAISLFDGLGASYIIHNDGSIAIKPESAGAAFGGYNLFVSMVVAGANQADIDAVEAEIAEGNPGETLIKMADSEWLVSYYPFGEDNAVVVAIPLTITAAQTYEGMSNTILFAMMLVFLLSVLVALVLYSYSYQERKRSRIVAAAEAKSAFFSKMSHDIRTPLNAVLGLQTLAQESDDLGMVKEYIRQSTVSAHYLLGIVNDVLDMSRIDSGKMTLSRDPFDMNELLNETNVIISGMASEKGVSYECETDGTYEHSYLGDAVRVKQVLINLLNNAVKFTEAGGSVCFVVSRREAEDSRDTFTFIIKDTGIGMSEKYLTQIFTPFEQEHSSLTAKYTGSGLGLSIVYSLLTLMGGSINVKSRLGAGTEFTVGLTLQRGKPVSAYPKPKETAASSFAGRRILLAEDNNINQFVVVSLLQKMFDIETDVAPDGEVALNRFIKSPVGYYDMILMDVNMPVMDGLEATRAIRALNRADAKNIPILALSANAYTEDAALSMEAGMNGHLAKPLEMGTLSVVLKKYFNNQEGSS